MVSIVASRGQTCLCSSGLLLAGGALALPVLARAQTAPDTPTADAAATASESLRTTKSADGEIVVIARIWFPPAQ